MNLLYIAFSGLCALVGLRQLAQRPTFWKIKRGVPSVETGLKPPRNVTQSWFEYAWPLTQITLLIECNPEQIQTTAPGLLLTAADDIREYAGHLFINHDVKDGVCCRFICRQSADAPSFFFGAYGSQTSPGIYGRQFGRLDSDIEREKIAILLQGISTTEHDRLAEWMFKIAFLIAGGKKEGTMHEDDAGWSFRVLSGR